MRALTMDELESVSGSKSQQPVEAAQQAIGLVDGGGIGGGGTGISKISIVVNGSAPNPYNVLDGRFGEIFYGPSPWLFADMPLVRGGDPNQVDRPSVDNSNGASYHVSDAAVAAALNYWRPASGLDKTEEIAVVGHQSVDTSQIESYMQNCGMWFMGRGTNAVYWTDMEEMLVEASRNGVNTAFIFGHENDAKTHAPATHGYMIDGHITIASGLDLSVHNISDLKRLNLPTDLEAKIKPYLLLKGEDATKMLAENPLNITMREASLINNAVVDVMTSDVSRNYKNFTGRDFDLLPDAVKTVLVDVAYVEGPKFGQNRIAIDQHFYEAVIAYNPASAKTNTDRYSHPE